MTLYRLVLFHDTSEIKSCKKCIISQFTHLFIDIFPLTPLCIHITMCYLLSLSFRNFSYISLQLLSSYISLFLYLFTCNLPFFLFGVLNNSKSIVELLLQIYRLLLCLPALADFSSLILSRRETPLLVT